jgi:biofilm PGA synthesis N-glycosyltransferase PgaC
MRSAGPGRLRPIRWKHHGDHGVSPRAHHPENPMPATTQNSQPDAPARPPLEPAPRRFDLPIGLKFVLAIAFAALWTAGSVWLSLPWVLDLSRAFGAPAALVIVGLVAYLPGYIVAMLTMSLILDRQAPPTARNPLSPLTIIVAARNEAAGIADTIRRLAQGDYAGEVTIILADNGSEDDTAAVAGRAAEEAGTSLQVIHEPRPGKAYALNTALQQVVTPYVITVDADTLLHREALRRLISRLEAEPANTVAVAGSVLVRNSRANLLTRMQEWDYYLGIASVKRMQGVYQSTLVAQGAFSVYRTQQIRGIGGWPDAIGEDIVVTWKLLEQGGRVIFEPTAVAFTDVPTTLSHFMRQRSRWARGMFEGMRAVPPWHQHRRLARLISAIDLLIPLLDIGYVFIWLPGLVLFLFGNPIIVSAWTLAVLPVTMVIYGGLRTYQRRRVFRPLGLTVRRNWVGYLAFLVGYQALCSVASLVGYAQFLAGSARRWE